MDPLVFSVMTSESESASGSAMKVHPGDCAAPLDVLEWLDKFDASGGPAQAAGPILKTLAVHVGWARVPFTGTSASRIKPR